MSLYPGYPSHLVTTAPGVQIACVTGGEGPPLLLLHGHPQTKAIWHKVAPVLARHFTLVIADLRGYGDSSKPAGDADHALYAKRTMAADLLAVMRQLGHERFQVLAHDRGARVAHRLAADHPQAVQRLVVLDIAPTLAMYEQTNEAFARAYWHWFFLIQPAPLPERLIEADPSAYLHDVMGRRSAGLSPFTPEAWADYERCIALPGAAHAMCEDYRAAAGIDLEHDRAAREAGQKIACDTLVLWGALGVVQAMFDPLALWRAQCSATVSGRALEAGHFLAEERPEETAEALLAFFR